MNAPTLPAQIAAINSASEIIAANGASIKLHGWTEAEIDAAQIGLGRVRSTLEWLIRNEPAIRAALAKREEPAT
jgi:hypothetical protein